MELVRDEKSSMGVLVQGSLPCNWANQLQQDIAKFPVQGQCVRVATTLISCIVAS